MNMIRPEEETTSPNISPARKRIGAFSLHFLLPLAVLASGVGITAYLMNTSPQAMPVERQPTATLVEVRTVQAGQQQTLVAAMGEVIPAREIDLSAQVDGEIIAASQEFLPGGRFLAGETLLNIDPVEYHLVLNQLESEIQRAESDLLLEMGNQQIAAREFALLNEAVSPEERALILRQPQLAKLEASLASARARLAQARLDVARTEVRVPFNAVIQSRHVDIGTRVSESTPLVRLVGTDFFWMRLTLPVEKLQWLKIPVNDGDTGSEVKIFPQGGAGSGPYRSGQLLRLEATLEPQGRMAQVLVQIEDPLSLKPANSGLPKLLLGSFVNAEIVGMPIDSAITLDRSHIHDGNKAWLMDEEGRLEIREVEILFKNQNEVMVGDGLRSGERLVVTQLSSPVAGIPLRLEALGGDADSQPGERAGKAVTRQGESRAQ
jgi:RND family efflux transporter MFP subunit